MHHDTSPIREVSVITTGRVALHTEHVYGTRKPALWWIFWGRERVEVPMTMFVIEHDDGLVLFDTGPDPGLVTDPEYWPDRITRAFMNHIFSFELGEDDRLATQLERAGYDPHDVKKVVLSHLHFDHAGGVHDVPHAELLVSPDAWHHLLEPHAHREGVLRRDLVVPGLHWAHIEFEPTTDPTLASFGESFDVMGDDSLIVLPTPGHLPGSVSLLIRRPDHAPVLLIGDLTYSDELIDRDQTPGTGDRKQLLASFAKVRALREAMPTLVVIASHDPLAADKLAVTSDVLDVA